MSEKELVPGVWVWILNHNGTLIGSGQITDDPHDVGELPVRVAYIGLMRIDVNALEWHPMNKWDLST